MKRYAVYIILILYIIVIRSMAVAGIADTKHNLSVTGPGTIKAVSESQICVFCHTPHSARADAPLWNRIDVSDTYEKYTSDVLNELGYPAADDPKTILSTDVHAKTRVCLSCHDGTIALGNVVNMPGTGMAGTIDMEDGGLSITTMPERSVGYIGLDLRDDHPVAIQYLGPGGDTELLATMGGVENKVRGYSIMDGKKKSFSGADVYIECTSCHDPHDNQNGNFLVETNAGSNICNSCHTKDTGLSTGTAHGSSGESYSAGDSGEIGSTVAGVGCMACHFPHKAGISDATSLPRADYANLSALPRLGYYLLTFQEEMSCFNNNSRWTGALVSACHGDMSPPDRNIEQVESGNLGRNHPTMSSSLSGRHEATEERIGKGWIGSSQERWHVECADCHNPHTAGSANHNAPTNDVLSDSPLYGVAGVLMSDAPTWAIGNNGNYVPINGVGVTGSSGSVTKEYQICFKCHSDYAWNTATPPTSPTLFAPMTNQALEFSTNNISFHPVMGPNGSNEGTMKSGPPNWDTGTQVMYCSDCHSNENLGYPKGPHGSSYKAILMADYNDEASTSSADQPSHLCLVCHEQSVYLTANPDTPAGTGTGFRLSGSSPQKAGVNLHTQHAYLSQNPTSVSNPFQYRCVNCHIRVPHGWNERRAMVLYNGDPYASTYKPAGATSALIVSPFFFPAAPGGYTYTTLGNRNDNCSTVNGCH